MAACAQVTVCSAFGVPPEGCLRGAALLVEVTAALEEHAVLLEQRLRARVALQLKPRAVGREVALVRSFSAPTLSPMGRTPGCAERPTTARSSTSEEGSLPSPSPRKSTTSPLSDKREVVQLDAGFQPSQRVRGDGDVTAALAGPTLAVSLPSDDSSVTSPCRPCESSAVEQVQHAAVLQRVHALMAEAACVGRRLRVSDEPFRALVREETRMPAFLGRVLFGRCVEAGVVREANVALLVARVEAAASALGLGSGGADEGGHREQGPSAPSHTRLLSHPRSPNDASTARLLSRLATAARTRCLGRSISVLDFLALWPEGTTAALDSGTADPKAARILLLLRPTPDPALVHAVLDSRGGTLAQAAAAGAQGDGQYRVAAALGAVLARTPPCLPGPATRHTGFVHPISLLPPLSPSGRPAPFAPGHLIPLLESLIDCHPDLAGLRAPASARTRARYLAHTTAFLFSCVARSGACGWGVSATEVGASGLAEAIFATATAHKLGPPFSARTVARLEGLWNRGVGEEAACPPPVPASSSPPARSVVSTMTSMRKVLRQLSLVGRTPVEAAAPRPPRDMPLSSPSTAAAVRHRRRSLELLDAAAAVGAMRAQLQASGWREEEEARRSSVRACVPPSLPRPSHPDPDAGGDDGTTLALTALTALVCAALEPSPSASPNMASGDVAGEGVNPLILARMLEGAPRPLVSGVPGRACFEDASWLLVALSDRMRGAPSTHYLLRCMDVDGDGRVSRADVEHVLTARYWPGAGEGEGGSWVPPAPESAPLAVRAAVWESLQAVTDLMPSLAGAEGGTLTAGAILSRGTGAFLFDLLVAPAAPRAPGGARGGRERPSSRGVRRSASPVPAAVATWAHGAREAEAKQ